MGVGELLAAIVSALISAATALFAGRARSRARAHEQERQASRVTAKYEGDGKTMSGRVTVTNSSEDAARDIDITLGAFFHIWAWSSGSPTERIPFIGPGEMESRSGAWQFIPAHDHDDVELSIEWTHADKQGWSRKWTYGESSAPWRVAYRSRR